MSFEKNVKWKAASSLLDHLSSLFKAVLVTMNKVSFKLKPDVLEELRGRLDWAKRNYDFHSARFCPRLELRRFRRYRRIRRFRRFRRNRKLKM